MILKPFHVNKITLAKELHSKYQFLILENTHLNFIFTPSTKYLPLALLMWFLWLSSQENFCGNFRVTRKSYIQNSTELLNWFEITIRNNITFFFGSYTCSNTIRGLGEFGRFDMYVEIQFCHTKY